MTLPMDNQGDGAHNDDVNENLDLAAPYPDDLAVRSAIVCAPTRLDGRHHDHAGLLVETDDRSPVADA
jgi:hypothetical protein